MKNHAYVKPSDNLAQYMADSLDRQEVSPRWYFANLFGELRESRFFRWVGNDGFGTDPWRFYEDSPIEQEEMEAKGWRIFVQRSDLISKPL